MGNREKADSCHVVAERLAKLCPIFMWKEFVSDQLGYLMRIFLNKVLKMILLLVIKYKNKERN